jgi:hypothetical protein
MMGMKHLDEMDGAHSMHEVNKKSIQNFGWKTFKGRQPTRDLSMYGRTILKQILKK